MAVAGRQCGNIPAVVNALYGALGVMAAVIRQTELPRLLELERRRGDLLILPLIVRPCAYDLAEFPIPTASDGPSVFRLSHIQSVNPENVPLTKLTEPEQDEVFERLARQLHSVWSGIIGNT